MALVLALARDAPELARAAACNALAVVEGIAALTTPVRALLVVVAVEVTPSRPRLIDVAVEEVRATLEGSTFSSLASTITVAEAVAATEDVSFNAAAALSAAAAATASSSKSVVPA